jgi:hypothetical protein
MLWELLKTKRKEPSKRLQFQVITHGQADGYVKLQGRQATCPRCGHTTNRDRQKAISIRGRQPERVAVADQRGPGGAALAPCQRAWMELPEL